MSEEIQKPIAKELRDLKDLPETFASLNPESETFATDLKEAVDLLLISSDKCIEAHQAYKKVNAQLGEIASKNRLLDDEIEYERRQTKSCKTAENNKFYNNFFKQTIKDYQAVLADFDVKFSAEDNATLESYLSGFKLNLEKLVGTLTFLGLHKEEKDESAETSSETQVESAQANAEPATEETQAEQAAETNDNANEEVKENK